MSYSLKFLPSVLKEWRKLDLPIQRQFKKRLGEHLQNPHVPAARLRGYRNFYKIKLRSVGYRVVYEVCDTEIVVYVIAIEKCERGMVYTKAEKRI